MSGEKRKRRPYRRRSRKKGTEPVREAGSQGGPVLPEEGGEPGAAEDWRVPSGPEGGAAEGAEPGTRDEGSGEAAEPAEGGAPEGAPSRGRKRSRRGGGRKRGKKAPPPGEIALAEDTAGELGPSEEPGAGEVAAEAPGTQPGPVVHAEEPYGAEPGFEPEPGAEEGEGAPEGPETPAESAEGARRKRRRRRRGRRRGKSPEEGGAPAEAEKAPEEAPAEAETGEEFLGGAGQAALFEPEAHAVLPEEEAEEEGEEPEEEPPPGKGPKKVMLIDGSQPEEVRVAIVSDATLDYYEVENRKKKAFKGNIYKGKVVNIAHAIEAAFVDFGGGRHGFLPLNEYCGGALMENLGHWEEGQRRPPLRPGMEILVQVTKEESSVKGAALTSYISIAGRYLVMMLGMKRYGISKKIASDKERERIRKNMEKLTYPDHLGFIVRTVGAGEPLKNLRADMANLLKLWDRTVQGARSQKAPSLLYEEQDIVIRVLRDNYSGDVAEVLMDSADSHRKASDFFDVYYPKQKGRLKLVRQKRPLFFKYNLEEQLERLSARKVPLPSGGHLVIDRTEALWTVDVNSGRSSKDRDIEDTAFRTNKEAAQELARQLRLRDMGGLVVVDFIDMESRGHIKEVERALKEGLKRDRAKSDVSPMGKFGLVSLSRQRMGISYYDVLTRTCDACAGTGFLPTADTVLASLVRKVHDELSREAGREVTVRVSPALLEALLNQKRDEVSRLEKVCGSKVVFVADTTLAPDSFSVGPGGT